jgi:hypothetical protein
VLFYEVIVFVRVFIVGVVIVSYMKSPSVEYLSNVCAEAAPSLERGLVLVCAWDVSGFLPLVPRDRLYDEGFKG